MTRHPEEHATSVSYRELFTGDRGKLALGLLILEFMASVQMFFVATVLPLVAEEFRGGTLYGFALGAGTVALFISLPLTRSLVTAKGGPWVLKLGTIMYLLGLALLIAAPAMAIFVLGRFVQGLASGALAVFGLGAVVSHFPKNLRPRLIALMSSMWLLPALIGPAVSATVAELVGWRWALALLAPLLITGRILVARRLAAVPITPKKPSPPPIVETCALVVGIVLVLVAGSVASPAAVAAATVGVVLLIVGAARLLPRGSFRAVRGRPAAIFGLLLLTVSFFGADALITLLVRDGLGRSLGEAALALGAGTVCWSLATLLQPRLLAAVRDSQPTVAAVGVSGATIGLVISSLQVAQVIDAAGLSAFAWGLAGAGMGLAYPTFTVAALGEDADGGGTAVILTESIGAAIGLAVGGGLVAASFKLTDVPEGGLLWAMALFSAASATALIGAARMNRKRGAAASTSTEG